jgi:uncharacterized paraquat-inducible protein A
MVDVFVVSVLVALVQLGSIAGITPNVGIVAFASVVVLTMNRGVGLRSTPDVGRRRGQR